MTLFLRFLFLSGLGWLCDFATFALLVRGLGVAPFEANFASSYVGVTFVWFTSLKTVFRRDGTRQGLLAYWGYQFISIFAYSQLLQVVAGTLHGWVPGMEGLCAKILVTPLNLVTNFLFMKILTRSMRHRSHG
ncbi:GtrA family protein [Pseudoduganella chitinolytica]|uniref:GtrA family protein n=1 Tax=Pseudoduganella chitinolytica TaxID=34070 RepID=A0ABY8BAL2_9BURK|nr:GtrA family protein [Pseudoduganella chitinolytica]WEF32952.1 GtrA family protein [Pseudoduganella chitinolytica]